MTDILIRARAFALGAHAGQTRKGAASEPYFIHLEEVAALVAHYGGDVLAQAAAWLHDTIEDCPVSPALIAAEFGEGVAAVVAELTDDKALPKPERKRMQLVNAAHKSPAGALVKSCDKTSNIRALRLSPPADWDVARKRAYCDWGQGVVDALPDHGGPLNAARAGFADELAQTRAGLGL